MKNLADIRNEYKLRELDKKHVNADPLRQVEQWLNEAINAGLYEPTAMVLATVSKNGKPSSRVLLAKGITNEGLIFYTNYTSKKAREISANSFGAINFFWPELERQVRLEGSIEKISREESEKYFQSRPKGSQIGAVVSSQSEVIESRDLLEKMKVELEKKYEEKNIPCPDNWGGYILKPDYFEFWQGRPSRLHDRIIFVKENYSWKIQRLAP
ncbi:MAG: pyridoxamine 5'-phosphate oxidase [Cytophagaceae bacterium]|nr:pyridoxamine 5'-phosphate oxidase [Cytophagaceae bacterium]